MVTKRTSAATPANLRKTHRSLILGRIHAEPELSRAELARELGLSEMAVTRIARELIAAGLIEERETQKRPGGGRRSLGRPSISLVIAPEGLFAAGITVSAYQTVVSICDASGRLVARRPVEALPLEDVGATAQACGVALVELIRESRIDPDRLVGAGVALSARASHDCRRIVRSEYFGWESDGGRFCRTIEAATRLPVRIENLANALAVAEMRFGAARGVADFVVAHVATFVGLGIVSEGGLVRGSAGLSGLIGHLRAVARHLKCVCGRNDCLNLSAAGFGLLGEAGRLDHDAFDHARLPEYANALLEVLDSSEGAKQLAAAGAGLAPALDATIKLLGPKRIVLCGHLGADPAYFAGVADEMRRSFSDGPGAKAELVRGVVSAVAAAPLMALDTFCYSERLDFDRFARLSDKGALADA